MLENIEVPWSVSQVPRFMVRITGLGKTLYVYVIAKDGTLLMPTQKLGMLRHLWDDGKAVPIQTKPFTIQLTFKTGRHTQKINFFNDTGYKNVKVFAAIAKAEVYSVEIELLKGMKQPLEKRCKYYR